MYNPFMNKPPTFGDIDQINHIRAQAQVLEKEEEILDRYRKNTIKPTHINYEESSVYSAGCSECGATSEYVDSEEDALEEISETIKDTETGRIIRICSDCHSLIDN